jgi:hypothetical protein
MRRLPLALVLCALLVVLTACRDDPAAPRGAPRFAWGGPAEGPSSLDLIERDYAAGLLDRDNANRYRQFAVSAPDRLPARFRSAAIGKDATHSMLQMALDWDRLSAATQQEILELQADGFGQLQESLETEHVTLHYTTRGGHAVPPRDGDGNGIPDCIDVAAASWERV